MKTVDTPTQPAGGPIPVLDDGPQPALPAPALADAGTEINQPIGRILRNQGGPLDDAAIDEILRFQREHGIRFGEAAIALNHATRERVLAALSAQVKYTYPLLGAGKYPDIEVANNPFSVSSERFRELRGKLLSGPASGFRLKRSLAVVSPDIGDGRSYVASNLAAALCQLGGRTLLIDADMRRPRLGRSFGVEATYVGLSSILCGLTSDEAIKPIADMPGLYLLPLGVQPPNPLELLQSGAFDALIAELRQKFDWILVDTPATASCYDAQIVARCCESFVAVACRKHTRTRHLQTLVHDLRPHAAMEGVVFNQA